MSAGRADWIPGGVPANRIAQRACAVAFEMCSPRDWSCLSLPKPYRHYTYRAHIHAEQTEGRHACCVGRWYTYIRARVMYRLHLGNSNSTYIHAYVHIVHVMCKLPVVQRSGLDDAPRAVVLTTWQPGCLICRSSLLSADGTCSYTTSQACVLPATDLSGLWSASRRPSGSRAEASLLPLPRLPRQPLALVTSPENDDGITSEKSGRGHLTVRPACLRISNASRDPLSHSVICLRSRGLISETWGHGARAGSSNPGMHTTVYSGGWGRWMWGHHSSLCLVSTSPLVIRSEKRSPVAATPVLGEGRREGRRLRID